MAKKQKKNWWRLVIEYIKLQIAGNILFLGTYIGYAVGHELFGFNSLVSITIGSLIAHVLFFIVDRNWVFSERTGKRKTKQLIIRFVAFMGLNFFINLGITLGLEKYFGLSPYIGQLVAGMFFAVWSYLGLKFWVFRSGQHVRHQALTLVTPKTKEKRRVHVKRLKAKQEAKRASRVHR